jgi:lysophospholipase L1-like esterase
MLKKDLSPFVEKLEARSRKPGRYASPLIGCLGDSVTHGCFESREHRDGSLSDVYDFTAVYHQKLREGLSLFYPGAAPAVINAGVSGNSAPGGLERLERDLLSRKPDMVIVCFGLNDVHRGMEGIDDYVRAMNGILDRLRDIPCILLTPNMMNTKIVPELTTPTLIRIAEAAASLQNNGTMDAYMDAAREIAAKQGAVLCDEYRRQKTYYAHGVDMDNLLCNHINHPVRAVHSQWGLDLLNLIMSGGTMAV